MATRADQYRQLARDCRLMAQSIPAGENRSALLEMAEECYRLADQQEHATDPEERIGGVTKRLFGGHPTCRSALFLVKT
jgi:hypothetical protein